jgi:hypothetical protein
MCAKPRFSNVVGTNLSPGSPADTYPFYLGLDVSLQTGMACLLDFLAQKRVVPRWSFRNNRPEAKELAQKVGQLLTSYRAAILLVGMDSTGIYGWRLACLLSETPLLRAWSARVYMFNPYRTLNFKKAWRDLGKTDRVDALVVAQWLRLGHLPVPFTIDRVYGPLQRLTRFRCHLSETITREKVYTLGLLFLAFSEFGRQPLSKTRLVPPARQCWMNSLSMNWLPSTWKYSPPM